MTGIHKTLLLNSLLATAVVGGLACSAGCRSGDAGSPSGAPPATGDGWRTSPASEVGADTRLLGTMIDRIEAGVFVGIHSVLVAKDGKLVVEAYFDGYDRNTLHEIRSATKSIGSIITGIAIDKGLVASEDETVHQYFRHDYEPAGGWSERAKRVRIGHLLSMMSGYDCDDLATDFACEDAMYRTNDWVQYALDLPFAQDPGAQWAYNSSSLILVGEAIARAAETTIIDFARTHLFAPLGIERFRWSLSPRGRGWIGGGARMIPREMAKIGQLMLNDGVWNGRRLLSEDWIEKSTRRQGDMRGGVDYGYLWQRGWSYVGSDLVTAYWASGNGGQYIIVLPDCGMVVVFTGGNYDSPLAAQPFEILEDYIVPAFERPAPLDVVALTEDEMRRVTGAYELAFERSVISTVVIRDDSLRLISPDVDEIDLVAHSPTFFTGASRYGRLTIVFDMDDRAEVGRHTVYRAFSRYVFERR